jgi:hypothetical protein
MYVKTRISIVPKQYRKRIIGFLINDIVKNPKNANEIMEKKNRLNC